MDIGASVKILVGGQAGVVGTITRVMGSEHYSEMYDVEIPSRRGGTHTLPYMARELEVVDAR